MRSRVRSRPLEGKAPPEYPARGKKVKQQKKRTIGYHFRAALTHAAGLVVWGSLWWMNGYLTVMALYDMGAWVGASSGASPLSPLLMTLSWLMMSPFVAWTIHSISSLIEGFAWRDVLSSTGLTFLLVAALDIGSTIRGLYMEAGAREILVTGPELIGILSIAGFLAIAPEKMLTSHLDKLGVLYALNRILTGLRIRKRGDNAK
jgi:hypothetical protein